MYSTGMLRMLMLAHSDLMKLNLMIKNLIFSSRLCLIKYLLSALFVKSQDRNGFGSFFCGGGVEINKKSIKKLEKIIVVGEKSGIL